MAHDVGVGFQPNVLRRAKDAVPDRLGGVAHRASALHDVADGLEIGGSREPLYVVRVDAASREVVVGPRAALAVAAARLSGVNWIGGDHDGPLTSKVRSMAKPVPARLEGDRLLFDAPEYGVAPGQAAVLYAGDRVLGGGWIAATEAAALAAAA